MDRRTEVRFGANQPVIVLVNGQPAAQGIAGKIAGASKSGLRILVDVPMEINAPVTVQWDAGALTGAVRHCRQLRPTGFSVGVRIIEVLQPSKLRTNQLESAQP